ncbi:NUDIX domain-containing protein [Arthrobacter agilis]|uniref:NUDIX domain-containing protein n=1 Tax=Arthrobacter agilis TaxID=37921 RepID=UPI00278A04A1|nr:NUDIX domain-containing protein [Arthrobacter agilis]MDQ0734067.1 nudix-type nucleoside diphosphatase (YffH/AdpP family) [Arthrobacter agilis]
MGTDNSAGARIGVDVPDARGRVELDREGRDLVRNARVRILGVEVLASDWHVLRKTTYEYTRLDGSRSIEHRETYDRGNGATVLLYDLEHRTVLLVRQFRYPAYVNDHADGMLLEAPAGLLDEDDPATAIRREAEEETGVTIGSLEHVLTAYMSPGSVTEVLYFYAAPYTDADRSGRGGGLRSDGEDLEVTELRFDDALAGIRRGDIVDAKTIMLLQWAALEGPFASGS